MAEITPAPIELKSKDPKERLKEITEKLEQGVKDVSKAQLSTLLKICNTLGCRLSEIVTDPETVDLLKSYEK